MTVYVDDSYIQATVPNGRARHTSRWCHMIADSTDELVKFALSIGLKAEWLQNPGKPTEHFDVTAPKRALAVRKGAVEVTWRELGLMIRGRR